MRNSCIKLSSLAVLLISSELSLQSKVSPDDDPDSGLHLYGPSPSPTGIHFTHENYTLANPHHSARSPSSTEQPLLNVSRSLSLRQNFPILLGFRFEELAFIRLIPYINPNRIFELRIYVFPPNESIGFRTRRHTLDPTPIGEQIALSTCNGDVCAILGKSASRNTILRPVFTSISGVLKRVKIRMNSGEFEGLTTEEIAECPVTARESITKSYRVLRLSPASKGLHDGDSNPDVYHGEPSSFSSGRHYHDPNHSSATPYCSSRSSPSAEQPLRDRSMSPSLRRTFNTLLGFRFEDFESIRLIPHMYPNRIFEIRRYVFPPDELIGLKTQNRVLDRMPTGDQLVLSTSSGDVCAILGKSSSRNTSFRPIFAYVPKNSKRVKINMNSGAVEEMTTEEIAECPVTAGDSITKSYKILRV